ncbi:alpha/beta-hydrolase [Clavulina sp. PMI_390]|nr:alpha/beta-hydrolase [Clavulina sp. PMI_390]
MTAPQIKAAKQFLSRDVSNSKDTDSERYFNYDAAKLLLQFSAIVYEHRNESIRDAIAAQHKGEAAKGAATGSLPLSQPKNKSVEISDMYNEKIDDALAHYGNKIIHEFCHLCEIEFEPVSELNATSSAFAGLFWDPKSNWIVVTFKGTSPIEFGELLSDLNTKMINVGSNIPGFKKVHKGFRECVYPEDVTLTGGVRPYDTILSGVKALAKWLKNNNGLPGSPKINIWFTGHSLGCATASLTYCRMLMRPKDLGKRSILRDAYMFAAPILTDRESVDVFNSKMLEDPEKPKTMWRITSNWDAVATLLPELGDYTNITVSPNNAFAFAHLGTELRLRDYPKMPGAIGNHLYYGAKIYMETVFSKDQLLDQRKTAWGKEGEEHRIWLARLYQSIPLIGRVFAHFTTNYWDQLDRSGFEGEAEWISDW